MNFRDLEYVVAVAEEGHFGRAATRCHVSQPTLSAQLRKLEDSLGVVLFERTSRRVAITRVGTEVLACARRAVEEVDRIQRLARAQGDPLAGPLRLGVIPTISPYLMPRFLGALRREHPQMQLLLSEETTDALVGRLKENEIDAAIIATEESDGMLVSELLYEEPFMAAVPASDPLANKQQLSSADLAGSELLLLTDVHCLRDQALALCGRTGAPAGLGDDLRAASLETLLHLVAAGYGVTLVPALAIGSGARVTEGVVARPIVGSRASRTVSLLFRRTFPRTEALKAIVAIIVSSVRAPV